MYELVNALSLAALSAAAGYSILKVGNCLQARANLFEAQAQREEALAEYHEAQAAHEKAHAGHVDALAATQQINADIGKLQLQMQDNTLRLQTQQVNNEILKLNGPAPKAKPQLVD